MTAVRIRNDYAIESHYLADVPLNELDQVIPAIKSWGLSESDLTPTLTGQFVVGDERYGAYFEVVIHEEEG